MLFTSSRLPLILTIVAGIAMITVTAWQGVRFWQNETSAGDTTSTADMTMAETDTRKVPEVNLASFALFGEPGKRRPKRNPILKTCRKPICGCFFAVCWPPRATFLVAR